MWKHLSRTALPLLNFGSNTVHPMPSTSTMSGCIILDLQCGHGMLFVVGAHIFIFRKYSRYARLPHYPSGSQSIEGMHNRLQNVIFNNSSNLAIDRVMDHLYHHFIYYARIEEHPDVRKPMKCYTRRVPNTRSRSFFPSPGGKKLPSTLIFVVFCI